MKGKKDQFEYMISEEFEQLAKEEEEEILKDSSIKMPEGFKESLKAKLDEQIKEKEKEELYSKLSEEDRLALEVGHKVLEEERNKEVEIEATRKKKRGKMYLTLAASLALVLGISVTSIGGPERIVSLMKSVVGNREVEQADSSDNNLTIVEENEEKAYQLVNEKLGIEPVRIVTQLEGFEFTDMEFDEALQIAELFYDYKGENFAYFINAYYLDASWGIDVEDKVTDQYKMNVKDCLIDIKEYSTKVTGTKRYSASFKYNGLEYYLIGTMNKEEFEEIVNNLFFSK